MGELQLVRLMEINITQSKSLSHHRLILLNAVKKKKTAVARFSESLTIFISYLSTEVYAMYLEFIICIC